MPDKGAHSRVIIVCPAQADSLCACLEAFQSLWLAWIEFTDSGSLPGLLWHSCKLESASQGRSVWILFLQVYSLLGPFQMFMELLFPAPVPQISKAIYMVLLPKLLTGISKLES